MIVPNPRSTDPALAATQRREPKRAGRERVVVLEPDPLTQWALKTYLQRWFGVDTTDNPEDALRLLDADEVTALIVSDEFPHWQVCRLEHHGRNRNHPLHVIHTVTDGAKLHCQRAPIDLIEKPFQLARLAELLGVPREEIPADG